MSLTIILLLLAVPPLAFTMYQLRNHPRGLYVLFFAEMWERFSYYGMRALLIFYLTWHFLFENSFSLTLYGAYVALVYLGPLLGGWLADKYIGFRKAVTFGAILLVIGHGLMGLHGPKADETLVVGDAVYALERPEYSEARERTILIDGAERAVEGFVDPEASSVLREVAYTPADGSEPQALFGLFNGLQSTQTFSDRLLGREPDGTFAGQATFYEPPAYAEVTASLTDSGLFGGLRNIAASIEPVSLDGRYYIRTDDASARDVRYVASDGAMATLSGQVVRERSPLYSTILFLALAFIVAGVGFLKPNISTCVGALYDQGDRRRDPGFTLYYMGINLGSYLSGILCALAAAYFGWWAGFGLAAVGMLAGLVVFVLGQGWLEGRADPPAEVDLKTPVFAGLNREWLVYGAGLLFVLAAFFLLQIASVMTITMHIVFAVVTLGIVVYMLTRLEPEARNSMIGLLILTVSSVLFWTLFDQGPTSLNLFAAAHVNNEVGGSPFPAPILQSANPLFIMYFAPLVAVLWTFLGNRNMEPNAFVKFGLAMLQIGAGFFVLNLGIQTATPDADGMLRISVLFILAMYFLHTTGEIFLSPVGLSAVTKMSAKQIVGFMMGYWFLASSYANIIAAQVAKATQVPEGAPAAESLAAYNAVYLQLGGAAVALGLVLLVLSPWLRKLTAAAEAHTSKMAVEYDNAPIDPSGVQRQQPGQ